MHDGGAANDVYDRICDAAEWRKALYEHRHGVGPTFCDDSLSIGDRMCRAG